MTAATDFSALCKTPALAVMGGSLIGTQAGNSSVVSKGLCSPDCLMSIRVVGFEVAVDDAVVDGLVNEKRQPLLGIKLYNFI